MATKKTKSEPAKTARKAKAAERGSASGFTSEERAAMRERARELKGAGKGDPEAALLEKVAAMPAAERAIAQRLHAIVKAEASVLAPTLWYGMPAYARDGKVVCFFQSADKFKSRYSTLGFTDKANLDDGAFWPTSFAVRALTPAVEARIAALVRRAAG